MKCKNIPDTANMLSVMFEGSDKFHNYLAGNHVWVIMKKSILFLLLNHAFWYM